MGEGQEDVLARVKYFFEHDYHDRGMVKWQGFYLSDHTEDVQKYTKARDKQIEQVELSTMSPEEVSEVLFEAFSKHLVIDYQLNHKSVQGMYSQVYRGRVSGYLDNEAFVDDSRINIEDINWCRINNEST